VRRYGDAEGSTGAGTIINGLRPVPPASVAAGGIVAPLYSDPEVRVLVVKVLWVVMVVAGGLVVKLVVGIVGMVAVIMAPGAEETIPAAGTMISGLRPAPLASVAVAGIVASL
jgi:hypothetical protein